MIDRKQIVIESTLQLFTEKGYQHTSVQDILDKANISKGAFNNYFSSENECLKAVLEQNCQERNVLKIAHYNLGDIYWEKNTPPKWLS